MIYNRKYGFKKAIGIPISFLIVICITLFFCSLYIRYLDNLEKENLQTYMYEITEKTATAFRNRIKCYVDSLETLAAVIGWSEIDENNIMTVLRKQLVTNQFDRIGGIDPNGIGIGIDKNIDVLSGNFLHRNYFHDSLAGKIAIEAFKKDFKTNVPSFTISVPIYADSDSAVHGILCGIISEAELQKQVELPVFGGLARFHIIDSNGNILILSKYADTAGNPDNFLDNDFEQTYSYDAFLANLKAGKRGSFGFKLPGSAEQFVTYQPLAIND